MWSFSWHIEALITDIFYHFKWDRGCECGTGFYIFFNLQQFFKKWQGAYIQSNKPTRSIDRENLSILWHWG